MNRGILVRMSDTLKARLRGQCAPGAHVDDADDDSCIRCSLGHVLEFGDSIGVVQGPTDYNNVPADNPAYDPAKIGPEVDVLWLPDMLRYAYPEDGLVEVPIPPTVAIDNPPVVAKFPIATVVEISAIGIFPASDYTTLQKIADKLRDELLAQFLAAGGRDVYPRWVEVRQATKEEVLCFTPRKVHYTRNGKTQACRTPYVAKRNLTTEREKVTCRLCQREFGLGERS
jgi:hypothetical protein